MTYSDGAASDAPRRGCKHDFEATPPQERDGLVERRPFGSQR